MALLNDRIHKELQFLASRDFTPASVLAEHFGVSERTIRTDISAINHSSDTGVTIRIKRKKGYYLVTERQKIHAQERARVRGTPLTTELHLIRKNNDDATPFDSCFLVMFQFRFRNLRRQLISKKIPLKPTCDRFEKRSQRITFTTLLIAAMASYYMEKSSIDAHASSTNVSIGNALPILRVLMPWNEKAVPLLI